MQRRTDFVGGGANLNFARQRIFDRPYEHSIQLTTYNVGKSLFNFEMLLTESARIQCSQHRYVKLFCEPDFVLKRY